jgi:hypothetical protein
MFVYITRCITTFVSFFLFIYGNGQNKEEDGGADEVESKEQEGSECDSREDEDESGEEGREMKMLLLPRSLCRKRLHKSRRWLFKILCRERQHKSLPLLPQPVRNASQLLLRLLPWLVKNRSQPFLLWLSKGNGIPSLIS